MRTSDFDYPLPEELIAQAPAEPRDSCRLMVVHRSSGLIEHRRFFEIGEYLDPGDCLVANQTRVRAARLVGRKAQSGGVAEVLLLNRREDLASDGSLWECLVKPGKRLKPGAMVEFFAGGARATAESLLVLTGEIDGYLEGQRGGRLVRLAAQGDRSLGEAVEAAGTLPLPPYITGYEGDLELYQTVYAQQQAHSAAAPTAGLHFTPELIAELKAKGVLWETVELEVGLDTFRLVEEDDPTQHHMHTERFSVPEACVDAIRQTQAADHRVIAVGTTSVRSLESAWDSEAGHIVPKYGATTDLFLLPGSVFHVVDAMITNFHVPRSSLMMLVSAFATRDLIMKAYEEAIAHHYRMLSFGDAMLII